MDKLRPWWKQFCVVNKEIFRLKKDDFAFFTILGGAVFVADVVAAYSPLYNRLVRLLVSQFVPGVKLPDEIPGHIGFRVAFMLCIAAAVYLLLYALRAPDIMAQQAAQIATLESDKQKLVSQADYRDQLAAVVGIKVNSVKRFCYILNEKGDSRVRQEESFVVLGLELRHLVRKLRSYSATDRKQPKIEAIGLPPDQQPENTCQQSGPESRFHIRFNKAIPKGQAITLLITEEIENNFAMARKNAGDVEYLGHWVYEPTELLELYVEFPKGYDVPFEDVSCQATYGISETRHRNEEERLRKEEALSRAFNSEGKLYLRLRVEKPVLTLAYELRWKLPDEKKKEVGKQ